MNENMRKIQAAINELLDPPEGWRSLLPLCAEWAEKTAQEATAFAIKNPGEHERIFKAYEKAHLAITYAKLARVALGSTEKIAFCVYKVADHCSSGAAQWGGYDEKERWILSTIVSESEAKS